MKVGQESIKSSQRPQTPPSSVSSSQRFSNSSGISGLSGALQSQSHKLWPQYRQIFLGQIKAKTFSTTSFSQWHFEVWSFFLLDEKKQQIHAITLGFFFKQVTLNVVDLGQKSLVLLLNCWHLITGSD